MVVKRAYAGKDVDMLITVDTMMENAIEHQVFLESKRSNWRSPYFQDIKRDLNTAVQKHLGKDNAKELREATIAVKAVQKPALFALAELKVQIESDFDDNKIQRNEILNTLGYKAYNADAKKLDQEALINLLFHFKTNATPALIATVTAKGTAEEIFDKIISYADELKNKNVTQEVKKGTRKEITQEAIIDFNEIYKRGIAVGKIAANFFLDNQAAKEQFSFTKIRKNINGDK